MPESDPPPDRQVHRITTAATGLSADQRSRTTRYLISMSIRTVCFIGAVVVPSPWRWILLAGAIFLPYIAVVMANAGADRTRGSDLQVVVRPQGPALGSGPADGTPTA